MLPQQKTSVIDYINNWWCNLNMLGCGVVRLDINLRRWEYYSFIKLFSFFFNCVVNVACVANIGLTTVPNFLWIWSAVFSSNFSFFYHYSFNFTVWQGSHFGRRGCSSNCEKNIMLLHLWFFRFNLINISEQIYLFAPRNFVPSFAFISNDTSSFTVVINTQSYYPNFA